MAVNLLPESLADQCLGCRRHCPSRTFFLVCILGRTINSNERAKRLGLGFARWAGKRYV